MIKDIKATALIVIYLYGTSITLIVRPFFDFGYINHLFLILLFFIAVCINNFKIAKKFIFIYSILFILISINLFFGKTFSYVFSDALYLVSYSLFPIYVFMHFHLDKIKLLDYWYKAAICFTILLPIYYMYLNLKYINYFEFGFLAHLNILIFAMSLFNYKRGSILFNIMFILINIILLIIFGSRMVVIASFGCILVALLYKKKDIKFGFLVSIAIIGIFFLLRNLGDILTYLYDYLRESGIVSRNLQLFIIQIQSSEETFFDDTILSGRDSIYPVIIDYLITSGILPSGLAMTRHITLGNYAHSHNFVLEIFLIFGMLLAPFILTYIMIKFILALKSEIKIILAIIGTSYFIRSLTGTYFILDPIFMVILGMLISTKFKKISRRGKNNAI